MHPWPQNVLTMGTFEATRMGCRTCSQPAPNGVTAYTALHKRRRRLRKQVQSGRPLLAVTIGSAEVRSQVGLLSAEHRFVGVAESSRRPLAAVVNEIATSKAEDRI